MLVATIKTDLGDIRLELFQEKAPLTVKNFVDLANQGFYKGLTFHRVLAGFMIQGGCPEGTGSGGPDHRFDDEFHPDLRHDGPGVLSMANAGLDAQGRGTNGSQFFITHVATPSLNDKHSVFGKVIEGQDVVNSIPPGAPGSGLVEPSQRTTMMEVVISEEDPADSAGKDVPDDLDETETNYG